MKNISEIKNIQEMINTVILGSALTVLDKIPDSSVNCIITSPPYWRLRDYGSVHQLGMEESISEYVLNLTNVFEAARRVLTSDGSLWVVLGDTYMNNSSYSTHGRQGFSGKTGTIQKSDKKVRPKSLCGVPDRFKISMIDSSWILRNEIIWYKPNAMPSSVKDRFTVDYEKVYFFTKNGEYYFKQQFDELKHPTAKNKIGGNKKCPDNATYSGNEYDASTLKGKNKRCVWSIPTTAFKEAHYATFPTNLVTTILKSGCPTDGIVLDMFGGAFTTAMVCNRNKIKWISNDINEEYCRIGENRLLLDDKQEFSVEFLAKFWE